MTSGITPREAGRGTFRIQCWSDIKWQSLALYSTEHRHRHESGRSCQYASHDFGIREKHCQDGNQWDLIGDDVEAGPDIVTPPLESAFAMVPYQSMRMTLRPISYRISLSLS
jgi:hypothetical protein